MIFIVGILQRFMHNPFLARARVHKVDEGPENTKPQIGCFNEHEAERAVKMSIIYGRAAALIYEGRKLAARNRNNFRQNSVHDFNQSKNRSWSWV